MNHRPVLSVIGLFLTTMAKFMLIPVIYDLITRKPIGYSLRKALA